MVIPTFVDLQGFVTFGSASAGVMAIFLIIKLIKLIVDIVIHGYALHSVYGWSLHLFGAIWSSITHLLLHLAKPLEKDVDKDQRDQENLLLTTVKIPPKDPPTSEAQHLTPTAPASSENASEKPVFRRVACIIKRQNKRVKMTNCKLKGTIE